MLQIENVEEKAMDQTKSEDNKADNRKKDQGSEQYQDKTYEEINASCFSQCLKDLNENYKKKKNHKEHKNLFDLN